MSTFAEWRRNARCPTFRGAVRPPCVLLAATLLVAAGRPAEAAADEAPQLRPNIIFILADDYGIDGVGCYGADRYKTPNLDALARAGTRFEHCFAAPLCAPSRALCMTGRYAFRTGVVDNGSGAKATPTGEVCIARLMKQAGYATAVAGKWRQLSYLTTKEDARAWGFDEFIVWGVGAKGERYWNPVYNRNGEVLAGVDDKYGPDLLNQFVLDFVDRHRDEPFFVYYPMVLIHSPILRTPDSPPGGKDFYADNIAYMDKLVGKLVDELDRLKLREKTLIVFTGDNGSTRRGTFGGRPIDGGKGSMLEGGSRVPLIANWPGTTPAGKVLADLVDLSDFYPTFAELAGAPLPGGVVIDGHSFAPQLRGQPGKPREWVYVQLGANRYVRDPRWKLTGDGDLFDMRDAPFRQIAVPAGSSDAQAEAARTRLQAVLDGLKAQNGSPGRSADKADKERKRAAGKRRLRKQAAAGD